MHIKTNDDEFTALYALKFTDLHVKISLLPCLKYVATLIQTISKHSVHVHLEDVACKLLMNFAIF